MCIVWLFMVILPRRKENYTVYIYSRKHFVCKSRCSLLLTITWILAVPVHESPEKALKRVRGQRSFCNANDAELCRIIGLADQITSYA